MSRLSEGLIFHVRQYGIVWKYIIWKYYGTEKAELWQSRQSRSASTSLRKKAEWKCDSGTTDLLHSRQKRCAKAELPTFGNESRVLVEKPSFRSLAVKIERDGRSETANLWMKCGSGTSHLRKSWQNKWGSVTWDLSKYWQSEVQKAELQIFASQGRAEVRKQNLRCLTVNTVRKCGTQLHIFCSQGRAKVRQRNVTFLAVKAEQKCGRGTSDLCQ